MPDKIVWDLFTIYKKRMLGDDDVYYNFAAKTAKTGVSRPQPFTLQRKYAAGPRRSSRSWLRHIQVWVKITL